MTQKVVVVFTGISEHDHLEFLNPVVSGLVSNEKDSGRPAQLDTEPEQDCDSQTKVTHWPNRNTIHQLPEQNTYISVEATLDTKLSANDSSKSSSHAVSPKPRQRLLGLFKRERDKSEVQSLPQEKAMTFKQKAQNNTQNFTQDAADMTVDNPSIVTQEAKPSNLMAVRTLQLTALQKIPFKEIVTSEDADTEQEATGGRCIQLPERLSNLKAESDEENSVPKTVLDIEELRDIDIAKTGMEASCITESDVESINNWIKLKMTVEDNADTSQENNSLPQTDSSILVDLSKEDGSYRANPVLIDEDSDNSLTGSLTELQISEPQKSVMSSVTSTATLKTLQQEENIEVPLSKVSNSGLQSEDSFVKTTEPRLSCEEYTEPRKTGLRVNESLSRSICRNKVISPQLDQRILLDNRENSEGEVQISSDKTNSSIALKSLKVTEKGFVGWTPERSPQRSFGETADVHLTSHQYQVRPETETQERWNKSPTSRSKDQNDEVRRSPSKTCHPKVLPRDSSSPKTSRLEGSPLKTFSINIDPQCKETEEYQEKPTPVPRQRKGVSNGAKQKMFADTKHSTDSSSHSLPSNPEIDGTPTGLSPSTSPQSKKGSEKTIPCLARSYIPQDYEYYLGSKENAYLPSFHQEKATAAESDVAHRPQNALRDSVGNHTDSPSDSIPSRISSWIVQNKHGNPSQDTTKTCSLPSKSSSSKSFFFSICIYLR